MKKKKKSLPIRSILTMAGNGVLLIVLILVFKQLIGSEWQDLKKKYVQNDISFGLNVNEKKVAIKARIRTLNRQIPDFETLVQVAHQPSLYRLKMLDPYRIYYQRVVEYLPRTPEAWGLLAYIEHFSPQSRSQAIELYEKAIYLNPEFFWFYHNLGLLYFQQGQPEKAAMVFNMALQKKFQTSAKFILSSRYVYRQLLSTYTHFFPLDLEAQFSSGKQDCFRMLLLSYDAMARYEAMIPVALKSLSVEGMEKEILYFYLGKATYHLKQYDRSVGFLNASLRLNPYNTDAMQLLALDLKALGQEAASINVLKKMVVIVRSGKAKKNEWNPPALKLY